MKRHVVIRIIQWTILLLLCAAIVSRTCDIRRSKEPVLQTEEAISWDRALDHLGEYRTVYGPVVDTHFAERSEGKPTFLNLGKPFPEEPRFTVVIWAGARESFSEPPEELFKGRTIRVTGRIEIYEGAAQIEVKGPEDIEPVDSL